MKKGGLSLRKELELESLRGEDDCWHMFRDFESPSFQIGLFLKIGVSFSFPAHYVRVDCEPEQEERSLFWGCTNWPAFTPGEVWGSSLSSAPFVPGPSSLLPHLVLCCWEDVGRLYEKRNRKSLEGAASSKLNVRFLAV